VEANEKVTSQGICPILIGNQTISARTYTAAPPAALGFGIFAAAKIPLSQCFQPAEQILLTRNPDDLISQLPVFEKKQRRNRANVVLG
jgi:hypothetical protein